MYNFDIYCRRNLEALTKPDCNGRESTLTHVVVTKLAIGLEYLGYYITMDNYFSSISLFMELASKGIYATRTMKANCIGLPLHLKSKQAFKRIEQGHMEWVMHKNQAILCIMWKDKCLVLLFATYSIPICTPCEVGDTVPRKHGAMRDHIFTSLMLVEYTKHMKGVDGAD